MAIATNQQVAKKQRLSFIGKGAALPDFEKRFSIPAQKLVKQHNPGLMGNVVYIT
jgi:hypothetical protein